MVKVMIDSDIILCESYKRKDRGIVLYNAEYAGSLWRQVEVFTRATIWVFENETKLVEEVDVEPPRPW
jgi:hypothetical protein